MVERKKLVGSEKIGNRQMVKQRGVEYDILVRWLVEDVKKIVVGEEKRFLFSVVKLKIFKVEVWRF